MFRFYSPRAKPRVAPGVIFMVPTRYFWQDTNERCTAIDVSLVTVEERGPHTMTRCSFTEGLVDTGIGPLGSSSLKSATACKEVAPGDVYKLSFIQLLGCPLVSKSSLLGAWFLHLSFRGPLLQSLGPFLVHPAPSVLLLSPFFSRLRNSRLFDLSCSHCAILPIYCPSTPYPI